MNCLAATSRVLRCLAIVVIVLFCCASRGVAQVNLGRVNVGASGNGLATVIITTAGVLGTISVRFMGAVGLDFTDAGGGSCATGTTYAVSATCTVNVGFTPRLAGQRKGAVVLLDTSGNVIGTEYVQGTGVGPQASILTGFGAATGLEQAVSYGEGPPLLGLAVDATETIYSTTDTATAVAIYGGW